MSYHLICLTFEWSYEHLITQISGMKKYIESRKDVELTVFNAVAKYLDQEVETSALEILHMPDLSKYDGVLIQGTVPGHRRKDSVLWMKLRDYVFL